MAPSSFRSWATRQPRGGAEGLTVELSVTLGSLGYRILAGDAELPANPQPAGPLCFLDDDLIAVTYVRHSVKPALATEPNPASFDLRLVALFLDPRDGSLVRRIEWPSRTATAGIARAPGGGFTLLTPDEIAAYSKDLRPVRSIANRLAGRGHGSDWFATPSPAGKYVVLRADGWELLDAASLSTVASGEWGTFPGVPLDDGEVIRADLRSQRVWVGALPGPYRTLYPPSAGNCGPVDKLHALNADQAFAWELGDARCAVLFSDRQGEALRKNLGSRDSVTQVAVSADGRRVAAAYARAVGGNFLLDIGASAAVLREIEVYGEGKVVARLKGSEYHIAGLRGMALSADGSRLAIITESGVLKVFALPRAVGKGLEH